MPNSNIDAALDLVTNEKPRMRMRAERNEHNRNKVETFAVGKVTKRMRLGRWIFVTRYLPTENKSGKKTYRPTFSYRADGQTWQTVSKAIFESQFTWALNKYGLVN